MNPRNDSPPRRAALVAAALSGTALAALAASAVAGAAPAEAARATCHGYPVTTTRSSGEITGTARRDVIRLTGPGRVRTGAGNDIICGSRFDDVIDAGTGRDVVLGGGGHDRIRGGAGHDYLFGEGGEDRLVGGPGGDTLHGGRGTDQVVRGDDSGAMENGLAAAPRDTVLTGTRAVSIMAEGRALTNLWATGTTFAFDWLPTRDVADRMGGYGVAWQVIDSPTFVNVLTVDDRTAAFWAGPGNGPMPGTVLTMYEQQPAAWGERVSLDLGDQLRAAPGATPGAVEVMNEVGGQHMLGLALGGAANGVSAVNPAFATSVPGWEIQAFRQPTTLRVRATTQPTQPGEWLFPPISGIPTTSVTFGDGTSIVPLRVLSDGTFVKG